MTNPAELFAAYMTAALDGEDTEHHTTEPRTTKEEAVDFLSHLIDSNQEDF